MSSSIVADGVGAQPQLHSPLLGRLAALELDNSPVIVALLLVLLVPVAASVLFRAKKGKRAPLMNPPGFFQTKTQVKRNYLKNGLKIFNDAKRQYPGQPFKVIASAGTFTILPSDRANEVKSIPPEKLNFRAQFSDICPIDIAGFGALTMLNHPRGIVQAVVTKRLTKRLATVTSPLAQETKFAMSKVFGENNDWAEVTIYPGLLDVVARVSSRIFLGPGLCRNLEWLDITKNFASHLMMGMSGIRVFPKLLRPFAHLIDPTVREMRSRYFQAKVIVDGLVQQRAKERKECLASGRPVPVYNDSIEWGEQEADGAAFNPTDLQLLLSFAAIHTTSDLVTQTMLHLASELESIEALRQEMIDVLPVRGWKKTSLFQLKLLDSAVREAQRTKPLFLANMIRSVMEDVTLEDGTLLSKGELVAVDATNLWDAERYKNPEKFNIRRFLDIRQNEPGGEHRAQLVSSASDHITFGYGKYMCPGRFFAANEIKMILCFMIMNYDWKLAPGTTLEPIYLGTDPMINHEAKLICRRREAEIDLASLQAEQE
ncbi:hypothetical protein RB597_007785 [Gaeumannomyces tritici]